MPAARRRPLPLKRGPRAAQGAAEDRALRRHWLSAPRAAGSVSDTGMLFRVSPEPHPNSAHIQASSMSPVRPPARL
jgi:hypothetical protein